MVRPTTAANRCRRDRPAAPTRRPVAAASGLQHLAILPNTRKATK